MLPAARKGPIMFRLGQARRRREVARNRRALDRAIASAPTPAMRDELIIVAQRDGMYGKR
ncbi:hypothetical protein [Microlunatus sp. Gsoil 973]|jgi:hypothetical protein|uniref:hypothetical protein n=1 Tax=Microlunatus sp. Gsoil 973 TaxID=2672569 RepID=UPI0012B44DBE|nr:hypothetical protein [Microlunatus sp. Gsoil 973]QGN34687.1 hypothetical protein GJV80_19705 [Microlunatus sp. Gsoil 973]